MHLVIYSIMVIRVRNADTKFKNNTSVGLKDAFTASEMIFDI